VLAGGYGGRWLTPARARSTTVGEAGGPAVFRPLAADACGLRVTAAVLGYLAAESARQCGPCMFGLPSIASDFAELADRPWAGHDVLTRLHRRLPVITGRGACNHPDGAVRLAASALEVFAEDVTAHAFGPGCGRTR
jgi:NADH:ubiquinone oxidoreductase subunit F (NADH-binding)